MADPGIDFFQYIKSEHGFDPQRLVSMANDAGREWADADAAASALEETLKSLRAKLALEYQHAGMSGRPGEAARPLSLQQSELRALADPRYEAHIELMVHARRRAQTLRVRYDMGRMYLELQRTLQATLRAELRAHGN